MRALYGINPVRSIPDAQAPAVPLLSREGSSAEPLDMGPGCLRASSPVHLRYLANMGVGASLSVAIQSEQGLWGLLACHHGTPKLLAPLIRDTLLALVQMASQRLFLMEARSEMRYLKRVLDSRELISSGRGHPVRSLARWDNSRRGRVDENDQPPDRRTPSERSVVYRAATGHVTS